MITTLTGIVLGADLNRIEFHSLSLSRELTSNTLSLAHLQSVLMLLASERDYPLAKSNDSSMKYIRYPQSYRATLVHIGSNMGKTLRNADTTQFRLQLSMKRIPDYIKTIFKLLTAASHLMRERMLPTYVNHIIRTIQEAIPPINTTIEQLTELGNFISEVRRYSVNATAVVNCSISNRTDLVRSHELKSTTILEQIHLTVKRMTRQFEQLADVCMRLAERAQSNLDTNVQSVGILTILYEIESTAYFIYQSANIFTRFCDRYVTDRMASVGRYLLLATDEDRWKGLSTLSDQLKKAMNDLANVSARYEREYDVNRSVLKDAYETLFGKFPDRSMLLQ